VSFLGGATAVRKFSLSGHSVNKVAMHSTLREEILSERLRSRYDDSEEIATDFQIRFVRVRRPI